MRLRLLAVAALAVAVVSCAREGEDKQVFQTAGLEGQLPVVQETAVLEEDPKALARAEAILQSWQDQGLVSMVDFQRGEIWMDPIFWRKHPELTRESAARHMAILRQEQTGLGVEMVIRDSESGDPLTAVRGDSMVIHTY